MPFSGFFTCFLGAVNKLFNSIATYYFLTIANDGNLSVFYKSIASYFLIFSDNLDKNNTLKNQLKLHSHACNMLCVPIGFQQIYCATVTVGANTFSRVMFQILDIFDKNTI